MHPAPKRTLAEHKGTVVTIRLEECADGSFRVYSFYVNGAGEHPFPPSYYTDRSEAESHYARSVLAATID